MPLSQFTKAKLEPGAVAGSFVIGVTGPLEDVPHASYVPPFVIHVTIIQTQTDQDHNPKHARRASGYTTMNAAGEWEAVLPVAQGVQFDAGRSARGIGVAVLARTEGYTSEVLTWCDHLPDLNGTIRPIETAE
jgi:hypothetical protein